MTAFGTISKWRITFYSRNHPDIKKKNTCFWTRNGVNTYLIDMFNRNALDKITFDYLISGNQSNYEPGHLHLLSKIHKLKIDALEHNHLNREKK